MDYTLNLTGLGRGLLGVFCILFFGFLISRDKKHINWRLLATGVIIHMAAAFVMFQVPVVRSGVEAVAGFFIKVIDFSDHGAAFLFGSLVTDHNSFGFIFAFHVLPTVIFFSAVSSLLYYFGILPAIVKGFAWFLSRSLKISGAECTAAAANIFLDQTSSPLLIKPYLAKMGKQEIFSVMVMGMSTIAGSVMMGYVAILAGDDPQLRLLYTSHFLTASILAAPAGLTLARLVYPKPGIVDNSIQIHREDIGTNPMDALARGTADGLQVAMIIGAVLIVFTSLIAMGDWALEQGVGSLFGINDWIASLSDGRYSGLNLKAITGTLFAPVAWIIGVETHSIFQVGELIGEKIVLNEFIAYSSLGGIIKEGALSDVRTTILTLYALCGFASLTSMGVQVSGFSALAPSQKGVVSRLAPLVVVVGSMTSLMSASVIGMFLG
tara:strand:- start:32060 stop:33370 length:1311 start_codon:yes stop_codon:yes gene_type:complete